MFSIDKLMKTIKHILRLLTKLLEDKELRLIKIGNGVQGPMEHSWNAQLLTIKTILPSL
jgi:hypothetical protein